MRPVPAPSAPPLRRQYGRLRWPFAWLLACLLTAGMLTLLAGVIRPPGVRESTERLQAALSAPAPGSTPPPVAPASPRLPPTTRPTSPVQPLPDSPASPRPASPASDAPPATATATAPPANASPAGAGKAEPGPRSSAPANTEPAPPAPPAAPQTLAQRCPQQVRPVFPPQALADGIEHGRVLARLHLDGEGRVREVSIIEASPRGYFEAATRAAARQWRCLPPGEAGETVRVPFEFGAG